VHELGAEAGSVYLDSDEVGTRLRGHHVCGGLARAQTSGAQLLRKGRWKWGCTGVASACAMSGSTGVAGAGARQFIGAAV
jgi:hypothetical protein